MKLFVKRSDILSIEVHDKSSLFTPEWREEIKSVWPFVKNKPSGFYHWYDESPANVENYLIEDKKAYHKPKAVFYLKNKEVYRKEFDSLNAAESFAEKIFNSSEDDLLTL